MMPQNTVKAIEGNEIDALLEAHRETWTREFPCFDGQQGRPTLRECVSEALNQDAKSKYTDIKLFIGGWLKIASFRWASEQFPKKQIEKEIARDNNSETDEERAWIIAQIKASNQTQRLQDAAEAKRKASLGGRGRTIPEHKPSAPADDENISPENYPFMWGFLRIKWADMRARAAA